MKKDNNAIFQRIWERCQPYGLSFVSSNGGTGKTTYFIICRLLRDALYRHIHFNVYVRYGYERELMAERLLNPQPTYSKRMCHALAVCEVEKDGDRFIFIREKKTGRRLCQVLDINGQAFYKRYGNLVQARRAVFDEALAEGGEYVPDELNKFCRLNFTMARSNEYHVLCLYNNTNPQFPYFNFFGGKNFTTHISTSGAFFCYFSANQFGATEAPAEKSIQAILQNTDYNAVYTANKFTVYPTFFEDIPVDINRRKCFKVLIGTRYFWIVLCADTLYLLRAKNKPTNKEVYTINDIEFSALPQIPSGVFANVRKFVSASRVKTPILQDTIFCKIFCEFF